jgi:hypothetical protein
MTIINESKTNLIWDVLMKIIEEKYEVEINYEIEREMDLIEKKNDKQG